MTPAHIHPSHAGPGDIAINTDVNAFIRVSFRQKSFSSDQRESDSDQTIDCRPSGPRVLGLCEH
jgi:hypothetical protein